MAERNNKNINNNADFNRSVQSVNTNDILQAAASSAFMHPPFYGSEIYNPELTTQDDQQQKTTTQESEHQEEPGSPPPPQNVDLFRSNLIEEVRKYPCVWDIKSRGFKNHELKKQAWSKIADQLHVEG